MIRPEKHGWPEEPTERHDLRQVLAVIAVSVGVTLLGVYLLYRWAV